MCNEYKKSIVKIKSFGKIDRRLITNCPLNMIDAYDLKKDLENSFPHSEFKIVPFISDINELHLDEYVIDNSYYIKGYDKKMKLTGILNDELVFNNCIKIKKSEVQ